MTKILLVGENQVDLRFLKIILEKSEYDVFSENFDKITEEYLDSLKPEIIIIDAESDDDAGFELCRYIRHSSKFKNIIVFLLCDLSDGDVAVEGFECGATDYLSKPINESEVNIRIASSLYSAETVQRAKLKNIDLTDKIQKIMSKINHPKAEMIFALANMAQSKDDLTGFHLERIKKYIYLLSEELRKNFKYSEIIDNKFIANIVPASLLHDIGKISIPEKILLKPGKLTEEEFEVMKTHTRLGFETLNDMEKNFGKSDFIECGKNIAKYHHERPDGTGYPEGLQENEIPLEAAIMALIDVYDALRMKKVYKPSVSHKRTVEIIKENKGKQFISDIVDAFLNIEKDFETVWFEYSAIGSMS